MSATAYRLRRRWTGWRKPHKVLGLVPDTTSSFVTLLDVARSQTWTVPVVGWERRTGKPVVLDVTTAELDIVDVRDEQRGRAACVWSATTICGGSPMPIARAEAMLGGQDDDSPPPPRAVS